jgi:hypothetical protein
MPPPVLLEPFVPFAAEGALVGKLLLAYGELENALCSCVAMARDDMDMVIKAMFRPRGETQRVEIADAIGRAPYRLLRFETQFSEAIAGMKHCLKIRNQFAHCNWHVAANRLCFIDMQEIAEKNALITNLGGLTFHYMDAVLLKRQETFFQYVADCLIYLNFEGRVRAGKLPSHGFVAPKKVQPPPLYIP